VLISVVGEVPPITARKVAESVRFDGATVDSSSGDSANVDNANVDNATSSLIERQGASR
jgi:sigma-E factor negative regulatory protein RseB